MLKRNIVINISELPLRSKALTEDDLKNLYGGCSSSYGRCNSDCDCCDRAGLEKFCDFGDNIGYNICYYYIVVTYEDGTKWRNLKQ
jgi:hypothetical protein